MKLWITGLAVLAAAALAYPLTGWLMSGKPLNDLALAQEGLARSGRPEQRGWSRDQDRPGDPPPPPPDPMDERGPGNSGGVDRPQLLADLLLFWALDTNSDGELSAEEIANAAVSLKRLDKNGDGKITAEELRLPLQNPRPERGNDRRPFRGPGQGETQGPTGDRTNRRPPPPGN